MSKICSFYYSRMIFRIEILFIENHLMDLVLFLLALWVLFIFKYFLKITPVINLLFRLSGFEMALAHRDRVQFNILRLNLIKILLILISIILDINVQLWKVLSAFLRVLLNWFLRLLFLLFFIFNHVKYVFTLLLANFSFFLLFDQIMILIDVADNCIRLIFKLISLFIQKLVLFLL